MSRTTKNEYTNRHNKIATYVPWKICKKHKVKTTERWYDHQPDTVTQNNNVTILWDMTIQTDREIKANRPGIIIQDKKFRKCMPIGIAVPFQKNTTMKIIEK